MNHPANTSRARFGHALWLSGAFFALMATNDDNGCVPDVPDPGEQAECTTAADCKGDPGVDCVGQWQCVSGQCDFECGTVPTGCYSDRDCDTGLVCNASEVCNAPPGCANGEPCPDVCYGECVKPDAPTACTSSDACQPGQHCSTDDGVCNSNCPDGMACPAVCWGECVPDANHGVCYGDSECAFGEYCDRDPCVFPGQTPAEAPSDSDAARPACGGVCTTKETCMGDGDCGADEYCGCAAYNGGEADPASGFAPCFMQCLPREGACNYDGDCKEGLVCEAGRCIEPQVECSSADQCPRGWSCEMQCGGTEPAADPDSSGAPAEDRLWCPSYCVPPVVTCGEEGFVCAPGQHCETVCYADCPPCDCMPGQDCACACIETCKSACVDDGPQMCSSDFDCAPGFYCGCASFNADGSGSSGDAAMPCMPQCIPSEPNGECTSDAECKDGYFCNTSWCAVPAPECDPSDASCGGEGRPFPGCTGWCEAKPTECKSDLECGEGSFCAYEVCAAGTPDGDPITTCWGHCQPRQPEYDCKSDANCVDAAGNQGYCEFQVCETYARPCSADDPNCGMMPPETYCYGFCRYEQPVSCTPWEDTCPTGTHCQETGGCAGGGPGFGMPCLMEYQCVPDEVPACLNDCDCAFGFACVAGACQLQEPVGMCDDSFACKEGYTCGCPDWRGDAGIACFPQCYAEKVCEPTYCWDGVCPDGYTCASECGAPGVPNGLVICPMVCVKETVPACASDCDCDPALACNNGVCERMGRINTCGLEPDCGTDADCAAGEYCHVTSWDEICPACVGCPCTVIPRGTCEPIVEVRKCATDLDCGAGEYCGCGSDPSCPMCDVCLFQCLPKQEPGSCKEDLDCGDGQVCTFYYPPCACPVDENGNYADCSWCQPIGVCEDAPVLPTECKQDADCGAGQRCEQNPCPSFVPCGPEGCPSCGGQCVPVEEPTACVRTGCSGQVCAAGDVATTCEYRDWYQCYRYAICDVDAAGTCGWQKTDEFIRCMEQYGGFTP